MPAIVTGQYGAGRCQKGDFQYTFDNTTQDTNDDVITDLSNQLANYTSSLVKIYGDMGSTTAIHHPSSINHLPSSIFHLSGQRVDENYKGIVIRDGRKIKQ